MRLLLAATTALIVTVLGATASAQPERMPLDQRQKAQQICQNDVFTLCEDSVPDEDRITACLRRHFKEVSAQCRKYMSHYGRSPRHHRRPHR